MFTYEEITFLSKKLKKNCVISEKGCWVYKVSKGTTRYGAITYRYKQYLAHRLSWMVFQGEIPLDKIVCHNCPETDNPACINPDHLFLGTYKENTADMRKKKKVFDFVGEKNNCAVLTEKIVLQMRSMYNMGMKIREIANHFKVKYFTCLDVLNRRNWNHI